MSCRPLCSTTAQRMEGHRSRDRRRSRVSQEIGDGEVNVRVAHVADDKWMVVLTWSTAPPRVFLYDRTASTKKHWFDVTRRSRAPPRRRCTRPRSRAATASTASYFTLPPGSDPDGDGKPAKPLPMVLFVHGGPWARDDWGFNPRTSGSPTAATRCSRELPRLHGLRQGVHQRRRQRVGAQDARRPARRRRVGRERRSPRTTRSRSWAAATAATRRSSA